MVLLAMLAALTFAMKVVMSYLPNIEPVSLMVLLMMVTFGWKGLAGVGVYVVMEILYYGLGQWNINYLYIWALLAVGAMLLRNMEHPLGWALLSGGFGLAFGILCAPVDIAIGGFGWAVSKWVSGIPFDIAHCAGNFIMALLLFKPLRQLMQRLYKR